MPVISISSDFGLQDGNTGVMKGVIYGICPDAKIVDMTHLIGPQDVRQIAYVLARQVFYFPENSVHIVVVDPGVGTARRPIAVRAGTQLFVGPDNGFLTLIYERAEKEGWPLQIVHTNRKEYWLPQVSDIFHGRDIFSPVGAYLAAGVSLGDMGEVVTDPVRLDLPRPQRDGASVRGEIVRVDHFGNMISNIPMEMLSDIDCARVDLKGKKLDRIWRTFGEQPVGTLMALPCSTGYLMVSVNQGSASLEITGERGDTIVVSDCNN
ncbi:MAG: SAM-dependent chlorinase/fluorinase [Anaerolineales bacterium]|nr:SAM-dependent chlorinase/fluorinase [Anaerolineales bacterium]